MEKSAGFSPDSLPNDTAGISPELLVEEVRYFINHVQQDMWEAYKSRFPTTVDGGISYAFFVTKERVDLLRNLLEYLVFFVDRLPMAADGADATVVFRHFKKTVRQYCSILDEKDVLGAVLIESLMRRPDGLTPDEVREKRNSIQQLITILIARANAPDPSGYFSLFHALRQVSEFWFWVKGEEFRHIRESDLYLYRLATLLASRLPTEAVVPSANG